MPTLHVFQHARMEGPGRIAVIAREMGHETKLYELFDGVAVPDEIPNEDLLVVMGGSMGVGDVGDRRWPFLSPELALLRRRLGDGGPVLGVCLGAQLIARALGASVHELRVGDPPVRVREVGWGAVTFVRPTGSEPSLAGLNDSEAVLHWHGDTFDLPRGAVLLASTLFCPNQMFRFGQKAYAIQFHVEVDADDVSLWAREDADFVVAAQGSSGPERLREDTARYARRHREVGDRMVRNLLSALL